MLTWSFISDPLVLDSVKMWESKVRMLSTELGSLNNLKSLFFFFFIIYLDQHDVSDSNLILGRENEHRVNSLVGKLVFVVS